MQRAPTVFSAASFKGPSETSFIHMPDGCHSFHSEILSPNSARFQISTTCCNSSEESRSQTNWSRHQGHQSRVSWLAVKFTQTRFVSISNNIDSSLMLARTRRFSRKQGKLLRNANSDTHLFHHAHRLLCEHIIL
jgi:hypothetical protein